MGVLFSCIAFLAAVLATDAQAMTLGYELDISRGKVPRPETLRRMADILSTLGYVQFQLYFEVSFAYPDHSLVWRGRPHVTPEEMKAFDAYCRSKGIDLIPYQAAFGHLAQWMEHPEYRKYAEHPSGRFVAKDMGPFKSMAVCPTDPETMTFLNGLFDALLPCFSSPFVNLGCDEVWDLHSIEGRSAGELRAKGVGRVYLDFVLELHKTLKARGKTLMFWSDIIRNYPELMKELPPDVIALDWGYEAYSPFGITSKAFRDAPCRFYVCPGTSSWCSFFGRHANMRANVEAAYQAARAYGGEGLLLTDWGDGGNPQPWLVSLPSLVYAAQMVRDGRTPTDAEVAAGVDAVCGCKVGAFLIRASNAFLKVPRPDSSNGTQLFELAVRPKDYKMPEHLTKADFAAAVAQLREAARLRDLSGAPDWVRDDIALFDLLVDFVARRVAGDEGPLADVYRERYTALWCRSNRPEGAEESLAKVFGNQ